MGSHEVHKTLSGQREDDRKWMTDNRKEPAMLNSFQHPLEERE